MPATSTKAGASLLDDGEDGGFGLDLPGDHQNEGGDHGDLLLDLDEDFQTPAANSGKF